MSPPRLRTRKAVNTTKIHRVRNLIIVNSFLILILSLYVNTLYEVMTWKSMINPARKPITCSILPTSRKLVS